MFKFFRGKNSLRPPEGIRTWQHGCERLSQTQTFKPRLCSHVLLFSLRNKLKALWCVHSVNRFQGTIIFLEILKNSLSSIETIFFRHGFHILCLLEAAKMLFIWFNVIILSSLVCHPRAVYSEITISVSKNKDFQCVSAAAYQVWADWCM